jgi:RNA polymerase-binding transcription factor DksA
VTRHDPEHDPVGTASPAVAAVTAAGRLRDAVADNAHQLVALEREHARIVAAAQASNADDEHDPEGATIAFEREQLTALLDLARRSRAALALALATLDDGSYGACEMCGQAISAGRLDARPEARTCITCAHASRG